MLRSLGGADKLEAEQDCCYAALSQCSQKKSKLKKKDKTRSQEISVSSHPTTANICRNDSNNKLSGCKPIRIWFLTFWLHLENLTWSEYWLERQWETRNTSRMSRHQSMSGRGTHAFSSFACSSDWWWQTRYGRTHIDMFGDGELLRCVTTDGPYVTVSCVIH